MNFIRTSLKEAAIQLRSRQFGLLYSLKAHSRIMKICSTPSQYDNILIRQCPLVYFLLSEQNTVLLDQLLADPGLKAHILDKVDDRIGVNAMNFAVLNGLDQMVELLQKHGDSLAKVQAGSGDTLLHLGARFNKREAINKGLEAGIGVDTQNNQGDTPLHMAVQQDHLEAAETLLEAGCRVDVANENKVVPLQEAVIGQSLPMVQLLSKDIDTLRNNKAMSLDPVHLAAQNQSLDILKLVSNEGSYLIEKESSPEMGGARPIHFAVNGRQQANVEYLLDMGANVNAQDVNQNTPLHLAVLLNDMGLVQTLLESEVQPELTNRDNMTVVDLASFIQDGQITRELKTRGTFGHMFSNRY